MDKIVPLSLPVKHHCAAQQCSIHLPTAVCVVCMAVNHSHVPKDLLGENFNIVEMPTKHCGTKEETAMSSSGAPRNDVGQPYSTANLTCGLTRLLTTIDDPNLRCQIDGDVLSVNECRSSLFAWPELDSLILQVSMYGICSYLKRQRHTHFYSRCATVYSCGPVNVEVVIQHSLSNISCKILVLFLH